MNITITEISVKNPGLFRHGADLELSVAESRYLVHDSMEPVIFIGDTMWVLIAQLCSVMSVFWLQDKVGVAFKSVSKELQQEIATVVAGNNSSDEQFAWAKDLLNYTQTDSAEEAAALPAGEKVLIYTPRHVCGAVVTADGKWRIFDPETATAEEFSVEEATQLYLEHATSFLHGR